jgi:hypothetical protein
MAPRTLLLSVLAAGAAFLSTFLLIGRSARTANDSAATADLTANAEGTLGPAAEQTRGQARNDRMRQLVGALSALGSAAPAPGPEGTPIPVPEATTPLQQLALEGSPRASSAAVTLRRHMRSAFANAIEPCIASTPKFRPFRLEVSSDFRLEAAPAGVQLSATKSRIRGGPLPRELVVCVRERLTSDRRIEGVTAEMDDVVAGGLPPTGREAFSYAVLPRPAQQPLAGPPVAN